MDKLEKTSSLPKSSYDRSKLILYARCDHDKYRWWNTWWDGPQKDAISADELKNVGEEATRITFALFEKYPNGVSDIVKLYYSGECEITGEDECNLYVNGEYAYYLIRLIKRQGDYNIYMNAYKK